MIPGAPVLTSCRWIMRFLNGKDKLKLAAPSMCTVCKKGSELFICSISSFGINRMRGQYLHRVIQKAPHLSQIHAFAAIDISQIDGRVGHAPVHLRADAQGLVS